MAAEAAAAETAPSAAEACEPVTGGGVTLSLPVSMLEGVDSLSDILSLNTCVCARCAAQRVHRRAR